MEFSAHVFGQRLKEERERLGLSQQQAADIAGVRREMWGKYERGGAEPGVFVLERFCARGADVVYLVYGRHSAHDGDGVDTSRLAIAIQAVSGHLEKKGIVARHDTAARLVTFVYEELTNAEGIEAANEAGKVVERLLKLFSREVTNG